MNRSETPGDDVGIVIILVLGLVVAVAALVPYWESLQ